MALTQLNSVVNCYSCVFTSNRAADGGAVHLSQDNGRHATDCFGKCLLNATSSAVVIADATFQANVATASGGGIHMATSNVVALPRSQFVGNVAGAVGGACFVGTGAQLLLSTASTFTANRAGANGGALAVTSGNAVTFSGGTVAGNTARGLGGGMYVADSALAVATGALNFVNNTAGRGGSAVYQQASAPAQLLNGTGGTGTVTYQGNVCLTAGGTVFLAVNGFLPPGTAATAAGGPRAVFTDNVAAVGRGVATQAVTLRGSLASPYPVTAFGVFLRPRWVSGLPGNTPMPLGPVLPTPPPPHSLPHITSCAPETPPHPPPSALLPSFAPSYTPPPNPHPQPVLRPCRRLRGRQHHRQRHRGDRGRDALPLRGPGEGAARVCMCMCSMGEGTIRCV